MIEVAACHGCSIHNVSDHLALDELPLWLAHFGNKLDYTFDVKKIEEMRREAFLKEMREAVAGKNG